MLTVYKYSIPVNDHFVLDIPEGAKILSFQEQYERCCLWALVNPEKSTEPRKFILVGTGHTITESLEKLDFIGTVKFANGKLMFHLFEMLGP